MLLLGALEEAGLQDPQRLRAVLELRALVLAGHHEAGGNVRDADRRVGRVHALATRAGGAIDVHADVLLLHLDVHVRGLGEHRHRDRRGVDPTR